MIITSLIVSAIAFIIYWPALTTVFGLHNDYSLLMTRFGTWFIESIHMMLIGRVLGGFLANVQGWCSHVIADFAMWRWLAFVCLVVAMVWMFALLKKRYGFKPFWAMVMVLSFLVIPCNQIHVIWTVHAFPGAVNMLLAIAVYVLFDKSFQHGSQFDNSPKASGCLALAFVLFIVALFVYFPTTIIFAFFTFCLILTRPLSQWPQTRRVVVRDMAFMLYGLVFYFWLDRKVVYPLGVDWIKWVPAIDPQYAVQLAHDWRPKEQMVIETLWLSLLGVWHTLKAPWSLTVLGVELLALIAWAATIGRRFVPTAGIFYFLQAMVCLGILWVIPTVPAIISSGIHVVKGYRVLLVPTMMLVTLKYVGWMNMEALMGAVGGKVSRAVVVVLVVLGLVAAFVNVRKVVDYRVGELRLLRAGVAEALRDPGIKKLTFIDGVQDQKLKDANMNLEFGYMMCLAQHVAPAIMGLLNEQHVPVNHFWGIRVVDADQYPSLEILPGDHVVSLSQDIVQ